MASEGDGCTLFARLADDLGEAGMRQQEYQGKATVVARHGTHNSTSGHSIGSPCPYWPIQGWGANGRFPHLAAFADTLWPNEALRMTRPVGSEIQKEMAQAGEFRSQPCDPDFNSRHASIHGEERGDETRQTRYPPRHKDLLDGALAIERQDDRPK
jgi:hypothetical protein